MVKRQQSQPQLAQPVDLSSAYQTGFATSVVPEGYKQEQLRAMSESLVDREEHIEGIDFVLIYSILMRGYLRALSSRRE